MGIGDASDQRQETGAQRADRNLGELIQELRVAGLGVQVLFAASPQLVRAANVQAIFGLTAVGGAVLSAVLLVSWYVAGAVAGGVITAVLGLLTVGLWFAVPLASRREAR